jgi:hypothetical protein
MASKAERRVFQQQGQSMLIV